MVITQLIKKDKDLINIIDNSFNINNIIINNKEKIKINKKSIRIEKDILYKPISRNQVLIGTAYDYMLRFELNKQYKIKEWNQFVSETIFYNLFYTDKKILLKSGFTENDYNKLKDIYTNIIHCIAELKYIEAYLYMAKIDIVYRSGKTDSLYKPITVNDIDDLNNLYDTVKNFNSINNIIFNPTFKYNQLIGDGDIIIDNKLIDIKLSQNNLLPISFIRQLILYDVLNEINNNIYNIKSYSIYNPRYNYEIEIDKNKIDIEYVKKYILNRYYDIKISNENQIDF